MLTKYGTDNIVVMLIMAFILISLGAVFLGKWYSYLLMLAGILLALFTIWFFRDPDRDIPQKAKDDLSYMISPADGKIVEIIHENEDVYLKKEALRISIFLSPLDVHVNRLPMTGVIEHLSYHPGDYMVAYHPKSSEKNEQTKIGMKTSYGKILFKQIVGIVARRLVWDIEEGDSVIAGERFGMMKFGSRMDIYFDPNSKLYVKQGDKVIAGESIMAKLPIK